MRDIREDAWWNAIVCLPEDAGSRPRSYGVRALALQTMWVEEVKSGQLRIRGLASSLMLGWLPAHMRRLHRLSLLFVRLGMAAVAFLFLGGFGFAISGILSAIIVGILFAVLTSSGPMEAVNHAFDSHPWGLAAWLVIAGEGIGLVVAAWLAWRLSARLFQALPAIPRRFAPLSLGAFLFLETSLSALTLPSAIKLAREHQIVTGQIRGVYPQDHGTVTYMYTVNGRRFDAGGSPENLAVLQPGSPVRVYYVPSEPGLSILHEPQRAALDTLLNNLLVGTFISIAPFGLMAVRSLLEARLPKRQASSPP